MDNDKQPLYQPIYQPIYQPKIINDKFYTRIRYTIGDKSCSKLTASLRLKNSLKFTYRNWNHVKIYYKTYFNCDDKGESSSSDEDSSSSNDESSSDEEGGYERALNRLMDKTEKEENQNAKDNLKMIEYIEETLAPGWLQVHIATYWL